MTSRSWAKLVKDPDTYAGEHFQIWACISQFDAATGTDTFRGQASYANQTYWYSDGDNALFTGDDAMLADSVEDDVVSMYVTVIGAYTYETQIGGSATAPSFEVNKITRRGSC